MKLECYDPRIGKRILTDNPTLIAARYAEAAGDDVNWEEVKKWADYCDEEVPTPHIHWRQKISQ